MKRRGIDKETKAWIRNASDERAAKNGCRFDPERAAWAVDWIQRYCCLYEGEFAGQPLILRDWQLDAVQRIFGWVKHSEEWGREVRRFRRGGVWVPKKNKKSPTLAAIGLYLLCGDGEQGQKVFSCAKDGRQAMIAHTHALEMVRRSPALSAECVINKSTGRITHEPTRSFYSVIAGDNINSQEGLNGSILVDETHVVDRRLMKVLRGAGISRSEPLQLEFSTAGNNPDGYGKEQFDYGQKVESGEFTDEEFFFQGFYAPQDVSDEDLAADPVKYGKMANPAWGHTIKQTEFLSHFNAAKHSISDLADFKMYRLNVWQRATNPWLKAGDWEKCREAFAEDDLAGKPCWAGLDLSKTRDMSALVLAFKGEGEEEHRLLPFFWLPESVAREKNHLASFLQWANDGFLELTPGDTVDYGFIKDRVRKLAEKFQIKALVYDETYAEKLTQEIAEGEKDSAGNVVHEGLGIERVAFSQSMMRFASPTADFERLVIGGKLRHDGHPVLAWQAGHVQVKTDVNQNKRPVKPSKDDHRKIDGIVAGIMALAMAMETPAEEELAFAIF